MERVSHPAADAARAGMSPVLGWVMYEKEFGDAAATSSVSGLNAAGNSQSRFFGDGHRRRQAVVRRQVPGHFDDQGQEALTVR
jgi:hypothetical protein